jgi:hypothetical protein
MRKSNWLLFLLFFTAGAANAHQDRILSVQPDGLIPEIPASFGRVSIKIKGLGSAAPMVQFGVGKHLTDLPSCVTRVIRTKSQSDIRVTGSWYHDEKTIPLKLSRVLLATAFMAKLHIHRLSISDNL